MGKVALDALIKLAEQHPEIFEGLIQSAFQLLAKELAKKATA